jgi:hypothetical protein
LRQFAPEIHGRNAVTHDLIAFQGANIDTFRTGYAQASVFIDSVKVVPYADGSGGTRSLAGAAMDTEAFVEPQFRIEAQIFGVLAPSASESAALQKNKRPATGTVMDGIFVYGFNDCCMRHINLLSLIYKTFRLLKIAAKDGQFQVGPG